MINAVRDSSGCLFDVGDCMTAKTRNMAFKCSHFDLVITYAAASSNNLSDCPNRFNNDPKFQSAMSLSNDCLLRINLGPFSIKLEFKSNPLFGRLLVLLFFIIAILLSFKIYSTVLSIVGIRLGIASGVGLALLVGVTFCSQINIPLYVVAVRQGQVKYELFPIWLLKSNNPAYKTRFQSHTFVGINLAGGLTPLVLALYQFSRTPPSAILTVAAIIAVISYFFVTVVPGMGVYTKSRLFWLMSLIAALAALRTVGTGHTAASVAFAGGVLGTLIGADLLHLKDLQPEKAIVPLNIGGAGLDDGIALCGLYSLLIAEWLPNIFTFLKL